jgi:hypothetical protein
LGKEEPCFNCFTAQLLTVLICWTKSIDSSWWSVRCECESACRHQLARKLFCGRLIFSKPPAKQRILFNRDIVGMVLRFGVGFQMSQYKLHKVIALIFLMPVRIMMWYGNKVVIGIWGRLVPGLLRLPKSKNAPVPYRNSGVFIWKLCTASDTL